MTREEMEAQATALGVPFNRRTKDETLSERIAEASAPQEVQEETPEEPVSRIRARVLWGNVWSSEGKHMRGEEHDFLISDFALLDAQDAIKRV